MIKIMIEEEKKNRKNAHKKTDVIFIQFQETKEKTASSSCNVLLFF